MRDIAFSPDGFEDFVHWASTDRRRYKKLVRLLRETARDPFEGIGKPEQLRGDLTGLWSRRIDDEHRLVYDVTEKAIVVIKARYHYQ